MNCNQIPQQAKNIVFAESATLVFSLIFFAVLDSTVINTEHCFAQNRSKNAILRNPQESF